MSALGHVWTAPWQGLSDGRSAALVGCGHVSGLFVRHGWPLALMLCADRVPISVRTPAKEKPRTTGGTVGGRGFRSVWGEPVMGREFPSLYWLYTRCLLPATPLPFCRPGLATVDHFSRN